MVGLLVDTVPPQTQQKTRKDLEKYKLSCILDYIYTSEYQSATQSVLLEAVNVVLVLVGHLIIVTILILILLIISAPSSLHR
jgi:hypothetical protein